MPRDATGDVRIEGALAGLQTAERVCEQRSIRLTELRKSVLEILWRAERPLGAYDLARRLQQARLKPLPITTVYRILGFLLEQGLVTRIESKNAYVACTRAGHPHTCMFFICECCGTSSEMENRAVDELCAQDAASIGFRISRQVIELQGTCANCDSATTR